MCSLVQAESYPISSMRAMSSSWLGKRLTPKRRLSSVADIGCRVARGAVRERATEHTESARRSTEETEAGGRSALTPFPSPARRARGDQLIRSRTVWRGPSNRRTNRSNQKQSALISVHRRFEAGLCDLRSLCGPCGSERPREEAPDGLDCLDGGEAVEPAADVEGVLLEHLDGEKQRARGEHQRALTGPIDVKVLHPGDEEEPGLEQVGEEDEQVALAADLEGDEAGEAVQVEGNGNQARNRLPAQCDDEERRHVDLVHVFVEALVVAHAPEVDEVHHEEIAEVHEHRQDGAGKRPPEHGQ